MNAKQLNTKLDEETGAHLASKLVHCCRPPAPRCEPHHTMAA